MSGVGGSGGATQGTGGVTATGNGGSTGAAGAGGMGSLPSGIPVEIEAIVEIGPAPKKRARNKPAAKRRRR